MFDNMRKDGLSHPAEKTKPALRRDCIQYLDAFRTLSASRLWNQVGPQRIVLSEMAGWLERLGYSGEDLFTACRMVSTLDDIEVSDFYKKQAAKAK